MSKKKLSKYKYSLSFFEKGYSSIRDSSRVLANASTILLKSGAVSQSVSLAILALEECAMIMVLNSLLYLKPEEDDWTDGLNKNSVSTETKLWSLDLFVQFLPILAEDDSRFNEEEEFRTNFNLRTCEMRDLLEEIEKVLPNNSVLSLEEIKQNGLCTKFDGGNVTAVNNDLSIELATSLNRLAEGLASLLDLMLTPTMLADHFKEIKKRRRFKNVGEW